MTRRRWIDEEVEGDTAFLTGSNAEHPSRVLRARVGQQFDIVTPAGVRSGTVSSVEPERVFFQLGDVITKDEHLPEVHLYLAIYKFDRLEWAIESPPTTHNFHHTPRVVCGPYEYSLNLMQTGEKADVR